MVALLARSNLQVRDVMEARISIETMVAGIAAQAGTEADWDALDRLEKSLVHAISIVMRTLRARLTRRSMLEYSTQLTNQR